MAKILATGLAVALFVGLQPAASYEQTYSLLRRVNGSELNTCVCLAVRRNSARTAEDMQRSIVELETKLKSESSRLKKKYEAENQDLIIQIDNLNRTNADLAKANKSLATKLRVNFDFSSGFRR